MRVAVFSTKRYDEERLLAANATAGHDLRFLEHRLTEGSAVLAEGSDAVCAFVNDDLSAPVVERLAEVGVRMIALRSAGFNHVDLEAAAAAGITVARVPAYSPYAVAEHAVALILTLDRKIHRAHNRVREGNFALDGLLGFDLHGKTVGVVGTGAIGRVFARIMTGFGCIVLGYDPQPSDDFAGEYVSLEQLLTDSDIVSLHCPLTPGTHHIIDAAAIARMPRGAMLINTSRGALVDALAVVDALKSGHLGYVGLDVYEEEEGLFFEDLSGAVIQDDVLSRLLSLPNVLVTGHQAFFTAEAVDNIAATTIANLTAFERGEGDLHEVSYGRVGS